MEPQPTVLRHANTMPPQPLSHQRSVARKPVGKQSVVSTPSSQTISLAHRPAPQQQHLQGGYPAHNQQVQQHQAQQQRPQSYHPGQQTHTGYPQQNPQQIHNAQPVIQPYLSSVTQHQQTQPIQHLAQQQQIPNQYPHQHQYQHQPQSHPQQTQHQQPHQAPQQIHQQQSPITQPNVQTQHQQPQQQHAPPLQQVSGQHPPQHPHQQPYQQQSPTQQQQIQTQHQHPQQQPFSPASSAPNIAQQTAQPTLASPHQSQPQPQASPASPTSQLPHTDPGQGNIGSSVADYGRPPSVVSSGPSIATPATTIASVAVPSATNPPTWEAQNSPAPVQQVPIVDIRRTSTGQPKLCNHCRKGIPLNVSVYTCLICSTAHIETNFCVWCFTSNAVNTSHSHDKSYYATESDPRVQPSVQDATTHMWTIRKNVSGRLWYTHNATGLKTHLKPTAAALSGFSGLPPGWDERRTPDGRTFYFNKRMGTSAWTKPANSLPDGWKELRTPDAVPFYVNEQLGLSTWDRPGQQPKQQTKQGNKVVVRRTRPGPGQPNTPQNVGDNILSATINAARITGQGVESASRQVGKLGKKKNWRKLGRMLNQVNGMTGDNSGSDGECNDYNDDGGFGFGDDSGGYQQQSQYQQDFDYQQSFSEQSQQSFDFGDSQQQQPMFQQPAFEQQTTFEYSVQSEQPSYDQSVFEQQPEQFTVTAEVSYTTTESQPAFEQQSYEPQQDQYSQQTYEQQPGLETQQQPTFESMPNQEPTIVPPQQTESFEPVPPSGQNDYLPPQAPQEPYAQPMQPIPQPMYQAPIQQTYTTQQYVYEPGQVPQLQQQQVTVSYQVPTYTLEPTPPTVPQSQPQQPVQPVYIPNNQPEIITSDAHLVEVPGTPDTTTLVLNSGYSGNDILAGTSLAAEQNTVVSQAPQDVVIEVAIGETQSPALGTACGPEPVVVQEYDTAAKTETFVSVDVVPVDNSFDVAERCNQLI